MILLITGITYTVVGIKNMWLHVFFSAALLTSMCTVVLILYVMTLPVTDAVQGAYFVAALCSGLLLGGGAMIFREITEGLGCLLGGFCLGMWLLCLHEGGLITNTGGKAAMLASFSVAGFALSFSRITREYALMGLMSFAGGTVVVLGIDCFTRAGLKEFWAYIWNLNDHLFPLGANTYPITKGMRVELALNCIFCMLGIVSQVRLWKVIKERRTARAEERAAVERMRDEEEATLGRALEAENARERSEWEAIYGNGTVNRDVSAAAAPSPPGSRDSGVADLNEKKGSHSGLTKDAQDGTVIELTELAPFDPSGSTPSDTDPKEAKMMVMTAGEDDTIAVDDSLSAMAGPDDLEKGLAVPGQGRPASMVSARSSQRLSRLSQSFSPEVVPLPFKVPGQTNAQYCEYEEEDDEDDRSSFATCADDDRSVILGRRDSRASSIRNRLSVESGRFMKRLSQHSVTSNYSKRRSETITPPRLAAQAGESREELVSEAARSERDDAAPADTTMDKTSKTGNAEETENGTSDGPPTTVATVVGPSKTTGTVEGAQKKPESVAETVTADVPSTEAAALQTEDAETKQPDPAGSVPIDGTNTEAEPTKDKQVACETPKESSTPKEARSVAASVVSSVPTSLTKDRLPARMSRVAMTYRTNEWAKHLAAAETPEPEEFDSKKDLDNSELATHVETTAPLDVCSLQQTAHSGTPGPAVLSRSSPAAPSPVVYRSNSRISRSPAVQEVNNTRASMMSAHSLRPSHSSRRMSTASHRMSADVSVHPIVEENASELLSVGEGSPPGSDKISPVSSARASLEQSWPRPPVPGVVSYSSPQTLLGLREMVLRNKTPQLGSTPSPIQGAGWPAPTSDAASVYSYAAPSPALSGEDLDNVPLAQRKHIMRQSSLMTIASQANNSPADPTVFDSSYQRESNPRGRLSTLPSQITREAQMANFRQSVQQDLRAGTPVISTGNNNNRESLLPSASAPALLGNAVRGVAVRQSIEYGRSKLLSQREQETQRKQYEQWEKERSDRLFEERMRRGDFADAHREALRRMQSAVKES